MALLIAGTVIMVLACCLSRWARDAAFFLLVAAASFQERMGFNLCSHFWYRGTTRGFNFSALDGLAVGVLIGSVLFSPPGERRWRWPASLGGILLFFVWACADVVFSQPKIYGAFELVQMLHGLLFFLAAFCFIRGERELAVLVLGLVCAVSLEGALALKERLLSGVYRVPATLDDANSFSMYLCAIAPVFVAAATSDLPKWVRWFSAAAIAPAAVSLVLTISRAGLVIFPLVMLATALFCVSWKITFRKVAVAVFVAVCVAGLVGREWYLFAARWSHDSLYKEYEGDRMVDSRGYYLRLAKVIIDDRPLLGVGLNNWSYWVSKKYDALVPPYEHDQNYDDLTYVPSKKQLAAFNYAAPAHCLLALTLGELGVPGLVIFSLLWLRWFQMGASFLWRRVPDAMHRLGVGLFFGTCGIFLQSVTEWVFRQAPIYLTIHLLLGALASLYWVKKHQAKPREPELIEALEEEQPEYEAAIA